MAASFAWFRPMSRVFLHPTDHNEQSGKYKEKL